MSDPTSSGAKVTDGPLGIPSDVLGRTSGGSPVSVTGSGHESDMTRGEIGRFWSFGFRIVELEADSPFTGRSTGCFIADLKGASGFSFADAI